MEDLSVRIVEAIPELLAAYHAQQTPAPGNMCKKEGCGGQVVQKLAGVSQAGYSYHSPACDKCGQVYLSAAHVQKVGHKEFEAMMDSPYGL